MQAEKPMNREEVIRNYRRFLADTRLSTDDVWLGGGSALIILGLRETTMDLDAGCRQNTMRKVARHFNRTPIAKGPKDGYIADCMLLPLEDYWMDLHSETTTIRNDLALIDGVSVYTLEACLRQKQILAAKLDREKDHVDIANIKRAMKERG